MFGLKVIRVAGDSMSPALPEGSFVLFRRASRYRIGDVVLVRHPEFGTIVKRIAAFEPGFLWLKGDHPSSVSREAMGCLPLKAVLGKQVWSVCPPSAEKAAA